ncbi:bacillithiol biosynthesis cysteine-adding enzyme BshC [Mucilaginibacter myungsuensis]|uniref:Putative cysteine ligase BshC n=1 Tax=Mucilaginibacter myungsuensis TaxID=649104 RepID=A0A929PXV4_9SPHI|nr:bacillithiol biosynthesis cysteine-adding enzyme BshC [Mucilaginibacter myungsuensis]MBE9662795.1 bacillithiol biosynthesis cysteine-adding enzyme BshC [Mucilaginibacter myungsuensis]MDN3598215.1 bacillithiol biosynthesis cysteine-adding enzyme BshC [Mucilaginibacter myungsuensis]
MDANCISYKDTGAFSQTVINYLEDAPDLRSFYSHRPTMEGFAEFFNHKKVAADRPLIAKVLTEQYQILTAYSSKDEHTLKAVLDNIELLKQDNTFTITTGHQLNIFAGPLYFIYKIVTAIKLARQLKDKFPDKNFVPVYWMASEDHDFAEINYTSIGGKKVHWWYEASGATGRIDPVSIRQALNQYKGVLGLEGYAEELGEIVNTAYTKFDRLADATRYLVNALFGQYGLVIIDADNIELKKHFAPYIEQDIIQQNSFKHITDTNKLLASTGVQIQVNPREINFFYLKDALRERLTFEDGLYKVLNTDISFTEDELKTEIKAYPQRFSPNVVMRPLYQEVILPNIAYIGGGAEVVYWLELKANFDHYGIDFPILILRNSALVIPKEVAPKITKMDLSLQDLFKPIDDIKKTWIKQHSEHELSLGTEWEQFAMIFEQVKQKASKIDPTLAPSTTAVEVRLKHAFDNLEKKLTRAEKRNYATRLEQIDQIKAALFPNGSLQERNENFGLFYVKFGQTFIDELIRHFQPLDFEFSLLTA